MLRAVTIRLAGLRSLNTSVQAREGVVLIRIVFLVLTPLGEFSPYLQHRRGAMRLLENKLAQRRDVACHAHLIVLTQDLRKPLQGVNVKVGRERHQPPEACLTGAERL